MKKKTTNIRVITIYAWCFLYILIGNQRHCRWKIYRCGCLASGSVWFLLGACITNHSCDALVNRSFNMVICSHCVKTATMSSSNPIQRTPISIRPYATKVCICAYTYPRFMSTGTARFTKPRLRTNTRNQILNTYRTHVRTKRTHNIVHTWILWHNQLFSWALMCTRHLVHIMLVSCAEGVSRHTHAHNKRRNCAPVGARACKTYMCACRLPPHTHTQPKIKTSCGCSGPCVQIQLLSD